MPRAWYASNQKVEAQTIQEGVISSVAAVEDEVNQWYVRVRFDACHPYRKCSLSTTTIKRSEGNPYASIYRMQYAGDENWKFIHLVVELPPEAYWQLRRAGWPFLGDRFRKAVHIDL